jgi:hypothetical protein
MSRPSIGDWFEAQRARIDHEAVATKNLGGVILELAKLYRSLTDEQRPQADEVITRWALSEDPARRFDGLVLIDKFGITSALASLRQLSDRLRGSIEAWALHDRAMVDGIVRRLSRRGSDGE